MKVFHSENHQIRWKSSRKSFGTRTLENQRKSTKLKGKYFSLKFTEKIYGNVLTQSSEEVLIVSKSNNCETYMMQWEKI